MPRIHIANTGESFEVPMQSSLMEACEEHSQSLFFGCGAGACGTCRIRVKENPENLSPLTDTEKHFLSLFHAEKEERLACQCTVLGDVTLISA